MIQQEKLPAKVSEVADMVGMSTSSIRRYIDQGFLQVEVPDKGPMLVTGGDIPISVERWAKALEPRLAELSRAIWGMRTDGCIEFLRNGRLAVIPFSDSPDTLRRLASLDGNSLMKAARDVDQHLT